MKHRLIVMGYAGHGKDTVCELLRNYGYTFTSSSEFAGKKIVYPVLKEKYGYESWEECFKDRVNHRSEWFNLIADYNKEDGARLGKEIFEENDIYCGLRNERELVKLVEVYSPYIPILIWVDASGRLKTEESITSNTIDPARVTIHIDNNGSRLELAKRVQDLVNFIENISYIDGIIYFDSLSNGKILDNPLNNVIQFGDRGDRDGY